MSLKSISLTEMAVQMQICQELEAVGLLRAKLQSYELQISSLQQLKITLCLAVLLPEPQQSLLLQS